MAPSTHLSGTLTFCFVDDMLPGLITCEFSSKFVAKISLVVFFHGLLLLLVVRYAAGDGRRRSLFKKLKQHPAIYHSNVVCYVTMLFFVSASAPTVDPPTNC